MAWRVNIAMTKGLNTVKANEQKKLERVKWWRETYKHQNSSIVMGHQREPSDREKLTFQTFNVLGRNTEEGDFKRGKTVNLELPSLAHLNSVYEWCECGMPNGVCCHDSSLDSVKLSEQLTVHKSPSQEYEDYQTRKNAFLARQQQP